jgi:hypothetical protein
VNAPAKRLNIMVLMMLPVVVTDEIIPIKLAIQKMTKTPFTATLGF